MRIARDSHTPDLTLGKGGDPLLGSRTGAFFPRRPLHAAPTKQRIHAIVAHDGRATGKADYVKALAAASRSPASVQLETPQDGDHVEWRSPRADVIERSAASSSRCSAARRSRGLWERMHSNRRCR